jgi:hypothetical protein
MILPLFLRFFNWIWNCSDSSVISVFHLISQLFLKKIIFNILYYCSLLDLHDRSLCWLGTGTSIKSGGVKLALLTLNTFTKDMN